MPTAAILSDNPYLYSDSSSKNLQEILLELEEEIRGTASNLRQLGLLIPEESETQQQQQQNNNNNNININISSETIINPVEKLQKCVESCEAAIQTQLLQLRRRVEDSAAISNKYKLLFPNPHYNNYNYNHHRLYSVPGASGSHALNTTLVEEHTPIITSNNNNNNNGVLSQDDNVRSYLSQFVDWDPLKLDHLVQAAMAVVNDISYSSKDNELHWTSSSSLSNNNNNNNNNSKGTGGIISGATFPPLSSPVSSSSLLLSQLQLQQQLQQQYSLTNRRSLNAVVDDLLLRQLRYDGVSLSIEMKVQLGCYDNINDTEITPFEVSVSEEIRRGILQPTFNINHHNYTVQDEENNNIYNKEENKYESNEQEGIIEDLIQMMQNAYPGTAHWISDILTLCTIANGGNVDTSRYTLFNFNEILTRLSSPVTTTNTNTNTTEMQEQQQQQHNSVFLTEGQYTDEHELNSMNALIVAVAATENEQENEAIQQQEQEEEEEEENIEIERERREHIGNIFRRQSRGTPASWTTFAENIISGPQQEEQQQEEEDQQLEGLEEEVLEEEEEEEEELGFDEEDDDDIQQDEEDSLAYSDEDDVDPNVNLTDSQYRDLNQQEEELEKGEDEEVINNNIKNNNNEAKDVNLVAFTRQRVKIFLSDLIIISALQWLSKMISNLNEKTKTETNESLTNGNSNFNTKIMQKAVEFVVELRRNPLVAWRLTAEEEYQESKKFNNINIEKEELFLNSEVSSSSSSPPTTLLLTFRHVLVALGYIPLAFSSEEQKHDMKENNNIEGDKIKDNEEIDCHDSAKVNERQTREQLLLCVAPFLRLWGGENFNNSDSLLSMDVFNEKDNEDHVSNNSNKTSGFIPSYTTPFVWRESILLDLLDQVHKLHKLKELLLQSNQTLSGIKMNSNTNNTSHSESLLYRFVYPFSNVMLSQLNDLSAKGLIGRFDEEQQSPAPFQLPPIATPIRRNSSSFPSTFTALLQNYSSPTQPSQSQQPQLVIVNTDNTRRAGLSTLRSLFGGSSSSRGRQRTSSNDSTLNNNNNNNNNNNIPPPPQYQQINSPGISHSPPQRPRNTVILELSHASTVLSHQNEIQRLATPSLLFPQEEAHLHSANPILQEGSITSLSWQPMFQKTMCYCPVTRRRCVDAFICCAGQEIMQAGVTPPVSIHHAGINPAQLLKCGHVISNRAVMGLLQRPHRQARNGAPCVRCPYCQLETPGDQLLMLRCIY